VSEHSSEDEVISEAPDQACTGAEDEQKRACDICEVMAIKPASRLHSPGVSSHRLSSEKSTVIQIEIEMLL